MNVLPIDGAPEKAYILLLSCQFGRAERPLFFEHFFGQRACHRRASTSDLSFLVCGNAVERLCALAHVAEIVESANENDSLSLYNLYL
jgi:hypothetical protein